jgi:antitoxin CcdA
MQAFYDLNAPKKAANLSLNSELLKKARTLSINLSATLDQALKDKLKNIEACLYLIS